MPTNVTTNINIPVVGKEQTEGFAKVWNYNGIAIVLDDPHIQFATDFVNLVLRNFVLQCYNNAAAQLAQAQAPPEEKKLVVEG